MSKSKEKDSKKNTSLRLNEKTLKALKIVAIHEDTSIQKIIENLVNEFLLERKIDINLSKPTKIKPSKKTDNKGVYDVKDSKVSREN